MPANHTLTVDLGDRSYPIYIGQNLLADPEVLTRHIHGHTAVIVTNEKIAPLYLEPLTKILVDKNIRFDSVILPDGEQFKTIESVETVIESLLTNRHDRQTTIIALGGGVIGDIAGFAASIYQRGVNFIQIPTTLLSQVDSSVGGKTGVNHPLGKNMIGAFYQPKAVIADTMTLNTLDDRELSAGMAEVIKYGLIHNPDFFKWLEDNVEGLMNRDNNLLAEAIRFSCETKAEVVAIDERESGLRAILNLGHTFGHAIEANMGYGNWLHGEAVAAGTIMAIELSEKEGWIDGEVKERTVNLFKKSGLPVSPPSELNREQYLTTMSMDKKSIDGHIKLVLLKNLGEAVVTDSYSKILLDQVLPAV
jgi:3-dehydroquinate synthase